MSLRYLYLAKPAPAPRIRRISHNQLVFTTEPLFLPVVARAATTGEGVGEPVGVGVPSPVSPFPFSVVVVAPVSLEAVVA